MSGAHALFDVLIPSEISMGDLTLFLMGRSILPTKSFTIAESLWKSIAFNLFVEKFCHDYITYVFNIEKTVD